MTLPEFTPHIKHVAMAVIIGAIILTITWKVIASNDLRAHDQVVLAEHQLQLDKDAQKAADQQAQKDAQAYTVLKQQMDSQNATLRGQITALTVALTQRQAQDRALPPPELATRHIELVGLLPGDVKPTAEGMLLTLPAERQTVVMLEEVPAARQTIANQGQIIANDKQELASIQVALNSSQAAVEACKVTLKSQESACEVEKKEIKAKARKHGFWWSLISFLGGVAARSAIP